MPNRGDNPPGFPATALQHHRALATAGNPDQFAKLSKIKIFRREGRKTVIIPFDYDDVIAGKNLESNILLRRGDVVFVP